MKSKYDGDCAMRRYQSAEQHLRRCIDAYRYYHGNGEDYETVKAFLSSDRSNEDKAGGIAECVSALNLGTSKVLTLGTGNVGKTTIIKQLVKLYGDGFTGKVRKSMRGQIY